MDIQSRRLHHFLLSDHLQRQQQYQNCKNFQCLLHKDDPFEDKSKRFEKKEECFASGVGVGGWIYSWIKMEIQIKMVVYDVWNELCKRWWTFYMLSYPH